MDKEFWRNKAIERGVEVMKLQKKLDTATDVLNEYANRENWSGEQKNVFRIGGFQEAARVLYDIQEIDNN